ncbi:MAG: hypothetical protein AAF632_27605 [Bacteroidota bacterium]
MDAWQAIGVAVITALIGPTVISFIQSYLKRRSQDLSNVVIAKDISTFSENFKNEFIVPDAEENYFFVQTGIRTNSKSIDSHIKLKNKLGEHFTWYHIRKAQGFLIFRNSELTISLNKWVEIYKIVLLVVAFAAMFAAVIFAYWTKGFTHTWYTFGVFMFVVLILMGLAYLALEALQPILIAKSMKKKLEKLKST